MKSATRILIFIFISFLFFGSKLVQTQTLEDSLLIYYKWDSDSVDYSGNGYNPVYFNAQYAHDRFGKDSSALYFNGEDHRIALPDIIDLKPDFPLSFAFWAKLLDDTPQHGVFFTNDFSEQAHCGAWINYSSTKRLSVSYGDGYYGFDPFTRRSKNSDQMIEPYGWYFFAGVIHDNSDIRVFINGIEDVGYYEGYAYYMSYIGEGGNIGRKDANYDRDPYYYKGYLDEFRYWSRGLSNYEILELYQEGLVATGSRTLDNSVVIYPNPALEILSVSHPWGGFFNFNILDVYGKLVSQGSTPKTIDVASLKPGIYFIQISNPGTKIIVTKKFIKK